MPPSLTADFNGDQAIWGWARAETTGNLCLGSREAAPERVGGFLAGLVSRKDAVRPAAGPFCNQGPKHSCETRGPIPNTRQMHIPLWLWFRWRYVKTPTEHSQYRIGSENPGNSGGGLEAGAW